MGNYIEKYEDPIKIFLEFSLNQIDFFKELPKKVKNEWIFNMNRRLYNKDDLLYKMNTNSTEMYVIQSGLVEIVHTMDKG